ncbi:Dimerisation domain of Zinc Transporter [Propionibacterium ruminifibrarum]|uniref:Dimerisation domain of Zinc Transporter n=1 Tax=Propionibacterium ruminifibrarum TaxID=1962131 RepID=A0A375I5T8_9ACTN|nr:cation diffusion facilitator family transporter [Propionibacterium ruminifibrarum]SPF68837.1 Dimerisation domain of Zinc Transporter [Propionibacterium ruminifibrarum]
MTNAPRYSPPVDLSRYAWLSIAAALTTILLKGGAAALTGSVSLLSDALESLVNLAAAVMALAMLKISIRPPDANHPFGHSKAEYFSAAVEGVMVLIAAAVIVWQAIERLIRPQMPEQLGIGLIISGVSAVINAAVGLLLIRRGDRLRSATLSADGRHLMTDVITSVAVLVGVGLVALTGWARLDPIVAIIAGVNIVRIGVGLVKSSVDGLMDIALPPELEARLTEVLEGRRTRDISFHAVRTRESGNRRFMEFHLLVPDEWSVKTSHDLAEDIVDELRGVEPDLRVTVHVEPLHDARSYEDIEI